MKMTMGLMMWGLTAMGSMACKKAEGPAGPPTVGQPAPDFSLADETGQTVRLGDLRGSPVIFYSYPKDDTPGCTAEAIAFSGAQQQLARLGAVVLGISAQDAASHQAFKAKHRLNFPLLVDPDHKVMDAWGMWNGQRADRMTYLIGPDGKVAHVWPRVSVQGHDQQVLAAVEALMGSADPPQH